MTIFLHIGTHKTGTTAIQRHLGRHANFYASQELWYPMEAELRNGGHASPNHLNIGHPIPCVLYKRYLNGMDGLPCKQLIQQYNKGRRRFAKISNTSAVASLQRINAGWFTPTLSP